MDNTAPAQQPASTAPYPVVPGARIKLRLTIAPDEHRVLAPSVQLDFATKKKIQPPSVFQPPPKPTYPQEGVPGFNVDMLRSRIDNGYRMALDNYQREVNDERNAFERANPQYTFSAPAIMEHEASAGVITLTVEIPDPRTRHWSFEYGGGPLEGAIYAETYYLQPLASLPTQKPNDQIQLSAEVQAKFASYAVVFSEQYVEQPPPPIKTVTVTDVEIEAPELPKKL